MFCGGNIYTGKVNLDDVLDFFDGKMPTNRGFVTRKDVQKVMKLLKDEGIESPSLLTTSNIWDLSKKAGTAILSQIKTLPRKLVMGSRRRKNKNQLVCNNRELLMYQ